MASISVFDCSVIQLPKVKNRKGNLSILENFKNIPFGVRRVFYIYDIPGGADRGAHSHIECHQFLVSVSGSFDVELDDGFTKRTINLNRPYIGLHIPPGIWASEKNFSSGSVCLALVSHIYDENDYIRDYSIFKNLKQNDSSYF